MATINKFNHLLMPFAFFIIDCLNVHVVNPLFYQMFQVNSTGSKQVSWQSYVIVFESRRIQKIRLYYIDCYNCACQANLLFCPQYENSNKSLCFHKTDCR